MIDARMGRDLIHVLEMNPDAHNQDTWAENTDCGTVMCAAGHLCDMVGGKFKWDDGFSHTAYVMMESLPKYYPGQSGPVYIPMAAQRILGCDVRTRERLFYEATDLADVKAILWPLIHAAERGEREVDFTGDEGPDNAE